MARSLTASGSQTPRLDYQLQCALRPGPFRCVFLSCIAKLSGARSGLAQAVFEGMPDSTAEGFPFDEP